MSSVEVTRWSMVDGSYKFGFFFLPLFLEIAMFASAAGLAGWILAQPTAGWSLADTPEIWAAAVAIPTVGYVRLCLCPF
jgi:hypothetical protein